MGWKIHQMDVKTTFLNSMIEEEVYIEHLEGFDTFNKESLVCKLKRAMYGLKQAPHAWYTRIDNYFTGLGFTKNEADANLYHIVVEVWQGDGELFVSQGMYANEILKKFHMDRSKPMETPLGVNWRKEDATLGEVVEATIYRQLAGSLMYLEQSEEESDFDPLVAGRQFRGIEFGFRYKSESFDPWSLALGAPGSDFVSLTARTTQKERKFGSSLFKAIVTGIGTSWERICCYSHSDNVFVSATLRFPVAHS
eukprot:PITA_05176